MNWTEQDLANWRAGKDGDANCTPLPKGRSNRAPGSKSPGAMNKTEARFAQYLDLQKKAANIVEWRFQEWTFKLADDCRYTPDFLVLKIWEAPNDIWVQDFILYDVKGRKMKGGKPTYWAEEDARIKIRVAARLWPWFKWCIVFPLPNGEWTEVQF